MLRVAICDDDASIREQLSDYLQRFSASSTIELTWKVFRDGKDLLSSDYTAFDLLILDVQMTCTNGIEVAREIRRNGSDITIILFTNFVQYALDGYEVQAFRFLLKPLEYDRFCEVVGKALLQMQVRRENGLSVRSKDGMLRILTDNILYVETARGHVIVHTRNGEEIACFSAMKDVEQELADQLFFRCHTAYLVNMQEISLIDKQDVILRDGTTIPLSKHRRKVLKEALTIFWGDHFL